MAGAMRSLFGLLSGSFDEDTKPDSELGASIDKRTLCFKDERAERGFLAARETRLASSLFLCSSFVIFYMLASLFIISADSYVREREPIWSSSGGTFLLIDDAYPIAVARNLQVIASACICAICMLISLSTWCRKKLGSFGLEIMAVGGVMIMVLLICFSSPWYLSRALGQDPKSVVKNDASIDDASMLLLMDAFMTTIHVALPIRWVSIWPTEILFVLCYAGLAFALGSPMPPDTIAMNIVMLFILALATGVGKRSLEFHERAQYARFIAEKSQRFEVEHRLEQFAGQQKQGTDEVGSLPETADSAAVFSNFEGLSQEEVEMRLKKICELGLEEHWLVCSNDVLPRPDDIVGSGGFGIVMEAEYHGAIVALKLPIAPSGPPATKGQSLVAIAHELRLLRRLRHPNIVQCYGACIVPVTGEILLVLECVRGAQLGDFVVEGPAPGAGERFKLADDVCCALAYLHAQRPIVVHGDVKCSNTLVERLATGVNAKLVDFGLSRLITKRARPLSGTLVWMAPEVLAGGCKPAASADVFSFGRLLYMIMTGQRPLAGVPRKNILQAMRGRGNYVVEWEDHLPFANECREIYEACTATEASSRPYAQQVRGDLRARAVPLYRDDREAAPSLDDAVQMARMSYTDRPQIPNPSEEKRPVELGQLNGYDLNRKEIDEVRMAIDTHL